MYATVSLSSRYIAAFIASVASTVNFTILSAREDLALLAARGAGRHEKTRERIPPRSASSPRLRRDRRPTRSRGRFRGRLPPDDARASATRRRRAARNGASTRGKRLSKKKHFAPTQVQSLPVVCLVARRGRPFQGQFEFHATVVPVQTPPAFTSARRTLSIPR